MEDQDRPAFFNELSSTYLRERRMHYFMINAMSRRVRQLQLGERALSFPADGSRDAVRIAMQEFLDDKLEITPKAAVLPGDMEDEEETIMIDGPEPFDMNADDEEL